MTSNPIVFHFCLFYKETQLVSAWIKAIQKGKYLLIPQRGKEVLLAMPQIVFHWKPARVLSDAASALVLLETEFTEGEALALTWDLETLHALLDFEKAYSWEEISADFLDGTSSGIVQLGLFLAIQQEKRLFKIRRGFYHVRSLDDLEQWDQQQLQQDEHQRQQDLLHQWITTIDEGLLSAESSQDPFLQKYLQYIESVLVEGRASPHWKKVAPLFRIEEKPSLYQEILLKNWLNKAGIPISWGKLQLKRAQIPLSFEDSLVKEATLMASQIEISSLSDDASFKTYTVDGKTTEDYDDAFSVIAVDANRLKIAVHIANVASFLSETHPLFEEAERRISSVYTPKGVIPMLPIELSNGGFSLRAGSPRPVISFIFEIDSAGSIIHQEILCQNVAVTQNLSYETVDQFIEKDQDFWPQLDHYCQILESVRFSKGSVRFERLEWKLEIEDPLAIQIIPMNRNTPSNRIVEELAVLVNQTVAGFFVHNQIPAIYRSQPPYEWLQGASKTLPVLPESIKLQPTQLSIHPMPHSGLACDAYVQITSPIRRFGDLLLQQQLVYFLETQTIRYSTEGLMAWILPLETAQKRYRKLEKDLINYWKLKYLQQQMDEIWDGVVTRATESGVTGVRLELIDYWCSVSGLGILERHAPVRLKITSVDLNAQSLQASMVW